MPLRLVPAVAGAVLCLPLGACQTTFGPPHSIPLPSQTAASYPSQPPLSQAPMCDNRRGPQCQVSR